ncbi:MAG: carboxypeptidase-like regulatory domain-containing protein [Bryobacterales bacterium]|nr:carboxypeptidase-like regulatory domain-containing protein [Bryobacterales bacterium]
MIQLTSRSGFPRPSLRLLLLALFATMSLFPQASGFVTNKSTNKAQPGVKVTLMKMAESGATTPVNTASSDAQGRFAFTDTLTGIYALEAEYQGVSYTQVIPPMLPKDNLQLSVYETTASPAAVAVEQHIYFLEPGSSQLVVSETYILNNNTQRTYRNPERGTIRFYLPPEAKGIVQTAIIGPDQRPVSTVAEKTAEANMYQVNYPLQPGESRVDLNFIVPYEGGAGVFRTVNRYTNAKTRLVVAPGVTVEGDSLASLGAEPRTQAQIFEHKGSDVAVKLSGSGAIAEAGGSAGGGEGESPQIQSALPAVYDNLKLITAAGAAALLFAFLLLYRRQAGHVAEDPEKRGGRHAG